MTVALTALQQRELEHLSSAKPHRMSGGLGSWCYHELGWVDPLSPQAAAALCRKGLAERREAYDRYRDDAGRDRVRFYWVYRPKGKS